MNRDLRPLALIWQVGLTMVVSILLSLAIGIWLDGVLGTRPLATLIFSVIGVSVGAIGVYRLIASLIEEAAERPAPPMGRREEHERQSREGDEESEEQQEDS
ncbi:MAG: AtpZ/AtpI family protein [Chloroflexi bacterium]|nr:AtpZ/AtpI family protein [Chloroflexota bacterium]